MTHYLAQATFNRKLVDDPQKVSVLSVTSNYKDASNNIKQHFSAGFSAEGIDLFFEGTPKVNDNNFADWVADPNGLGLGKVVSVERQTWRDEKGFTLTIMTLGNTTFDPVEGLAKVRRKFSYLKAYEGAEFYLYGSPSKIAV